MSDVQQARIAELREHLGDCIAALRTVQPQLALPPARTACEAVARAAELALLHPEARST